MMTKRKSFRVLCWSLALFVALASVQPAQAQSSSSSSGPRRQLVTIIFSSLGGAILGLSTLSFYGRPQDHLANLAIGAGVGAIAATIYVTYEAAAQPQQYLGERGDGFPLGPEVAQSAPTYQGIVGPILNYQMTF